MVRNCHNRPQVIHYIIMKHFLLQSERTRGKFKVSVCHLIAHVIMIVMILPALPINDVHQCNDSLFRLVGHDLDILFFTFFLLRCICHAPF